MGMVRKTLSIGTLGVVSFRSKKEKLRRAERELGEEHRQREVAESRIAAAEKRLKKVTADAERSHDKLAKSKRKQRRARKVAALIASAQPVVQHAAEQVREASTDGAKRGRKAGRKAGRRAHKAATRAAGATKEKVTPAAEKLAARVSDAVDEIRS